MSDRQLLVMTFIIVVVILGAVIQIKGGVTELDGRIVTAIIVGAALYRIIKKAGDE